MTTISTGSRDRNLGHSWATIVQTIGRHSRIATLMYVRLTLLSIDDGGFTAKELTNFKSNYSFISTLSIFLN